RLPGTCLSAQRPAAEHAVLGPAEQAVHEDELAHGPRKRLDRPKRDAATVVQQGDTKVVPVRCSSLAAITLPSRAAPDRLPSPPRSLSPRLHPGNGVTLYGSAHAGLRHQYPHAAPGRPRLPDPLARRPPAVCRSRPPCTTPGNLLCAVEPVRARL